MVYNHNGFSVLECPVRKYGIVNPIPDVAQLVALYNSPEYFATHMHYNFRALTSVQIQEQIKKAGQLHTTILGRHIDAVKSVLEIGPGGGFALAFFKNLGKEVKGVETSASSSVFMREKLGLSVDNAMLEDYSDPTQYDLVFLNHVLEHFLDPQAAMRKLASLVSPSGLLYIRVPNHNSYDRRAMGNAWPAYAPFHISYFSDASLKKLYEQNGFDVLVTQSFLSDQFLIGWPAQVRHVAKKIIALAGLQRNFSGRTISIVGRKRS